MRIRERYELAEEVTTRYQGAGRVEKGQRLDSFCLASGYGRKYAVKVLRGRRRLPLRKRVPRTRRYGPGFRAALKVCSEASDYLCSQRLQPFLGDLVLILERQAWHCYGVDPDRGSGQVSATVGWLRSLEPFMVKLDCFGLRSMADAA